MRKSNSATHALLNNVMHIHNTLNLHLGKKQPQATIPTAFLFSQLHFNNVTSDALFHGGHLVVLIKRFKVQTSESPQLNIVSGIRHGLHNWKYTDTQKYSEVSKGKGLLCFEFIYCRIFGMDIAQWTRIKPH